MVRTHGIAKRKQTYILQVKFGTSQACGRLVAALHIGQSPPYPGVNLPTSCDLPGS